MYSEGLVIILTRTSTKLTKQAVIELQRRVSSLVCRGQSNTGRGADVACTEPLLTLQTEEICALEREWSEPPALSVYCQTDRKRKGGQGNV